MSRTFVILILLILPEGISLLGQSDSIATLEIEFTGIRTTEGQIAININTPAEDFPKEPGLEIQFEKDQMQDGILTVQVDSLAYGIYAISVLDDLDYDLEMEMFLKIPKEGYGFSQNPEFKIRIPKFETCSFELNKPFHKITIRMKYHGKNK